MTVKFERLMRIANGLLVALVAYLLVRPGGLVTAAVVSRWKAHEQMVAVHDVWPRIAQDASRVDESGRRVVIAEFADYECPFCRASYLSIRRFLRDRPDIGLVEIQFPLAIHPAANDAARAAICAGLQGRFREMNDRLYTTTAWEQSGDWAAEARAAQIPDVNAFQECLASREATRILEADSMLAVRVAVAGTPTFATERGVHVGRVTDSALAAMVAGIRE